MKRPDLRVPELVMIGAMAFPALFPTLLQAEGDRQQPEPLTIATWGGAYEESQRRVGLHTDLGVPMRPYMPTASSHMDNAVIRDHHWYSQTGELREQWLRQWLEQ